MHCISLLASGSPPHTHVSQEEKTDLAPKPQLPTSIQHQHDYFHKNRDADLQFSEEEGVKNITKVV